MPSTFGESRPLVSVVMTVLNPHPVYFQQAVQSILFQEFSDFELIIVEDPSPRSGKVILQALTDPRIRYVENARKTSLVDQKNQGIAQASGEYVAYLDADDIAEPTRLAKQVGFLQSHREIDVLGSQINLIDDTGAIFGYRSFPLSHDDIVTAMRRYVPLSHPSLMIRRDVLVRNGGYQLRGYAAPEDYELWSRLVLAGATFANHPEALIRYRLHSGQMKMTHLRSTIEGMLHIKRLYWLDKMNWQDRLQMFGEQVLLWLPMWFVIQMLLIVRYRRHRRSNGTTLGLKLR